MGFEPAFVIKKKILSLISQIFFDVVFDDKSGLDQ